MKQYKVIRDCDANDFFMIESEDRESAFYDALYQIGWRIVEVSDEEVEDEE